MPGETYQYLADQRSQFGSELGDPDVKARLFSLTDNEVGSQGEQAHQAFVESVFNRATARGQTLKRTMASDYYPAKSRRYVPGADCQDTLDTVMAGSNPSELATGNASGEVQFNGGYKSAEAGGERFGREGPDLAWAARTQAALGTASPWRLRRRRLGR